MPCYNTIIKKKLKNPPKELPTESDLRSTVGATNHEDLHCILDGMTGEDITEVLKRIERRKRKRAEVLANYISMQR